MQPADDDGRRVGQTRAFFGPRASGWEDRFPDDGPRYERAIGELAPPQGGVVLDAGCGTGRALPFLRAAVGPKGVVIAADVTPEMLAEVHRHGRATGPSLLLSDVMALPLADRSVDAVFAAGLISHLADPEGGLTEVARVCRDGARLALFHPVGRAALAERHGRALSPDDVRAAPNIRAVLARTGWLCTAIDDGDDRYLVLAERDRGTSTGRPVRA